MQQKHNQKLVFGGVDLVGASLKHAFEVYNQIRDQLQPLMIESGYLENAPFSIFGITFRYGLKNDKKYQFYKGKKYNSLDIASELDMRVLLTADENDSDLLKEFFEIAALDSLIQAGKKYKLKIDALEERRSKLGFIPDWEYDMEEYPEILFEKYKASKTKH